MRSTYKPNRVRSTFLLILSLISMCIGYVSFLPVFLINPDYACRKVRKLWSTFIVKLCQLFGLILEVKGVVPNDQVIFVSNHTHLFETILLPSILRSRVTYITKPILKLLIYCQDFIKLSMDKDKKKTVSPGFFLNRLKEECIIRKKSVVVFPEGTRVQHGKQVEYFNLPSTLIRYLKVPIVPVSVNTSFIFGSNRGFNLDFSRSLNIHFHEPLNYNEAIVLALFDKNKLAEFEGYPSVTYKELAQLINTMKLTKTKIFLQPDVHTYLNCLETVEEKPQLLYEQLLELSAKHNLSKAIYNRLFKDFTLEVAQMHQLLFEVIPKKSSIDKDELFLSYLRSKIEGGIVRT